MRNSNLREIGPKRIGMLFGLILKGLAHGPEREPKTTSPKFALYSIAVSSFSLSDSFLQTRIRHRMLIKLAVIPRPAGSLSYIQQAVGCIMRTRIIGEEGSRELDVSTKYDSCLVQKIIESKPFNP